jgi:hypothetical protein
MARQLRGARSCAKPFSLSLVEVRKTPSVTTYKGGSLTWEATPCSFPENLDRVTREGERCKRTPRPRPQPESNRSEVLFDHKTRAAPRPLQLSTRLSAMIGLSWVGLVAAMLSLAANLQKREGTEMTVVQSILISGIGDRTPLACWAHSRCSV